MTARCVLTISISAVALGVVGCGGEARQDANEPSGTFTVDVAKASFPRKQQLATPEKMVIAVKNTGQQTVPDVAVTVDSFDERSDEPGLADPSRPVWVVDAGPVGGTTAYTNTWALNALKPGETRTFTWNVTPVVAGRYKLRYTVAAGLNGKAKAARAGGGAVTGSFPVQVSKTPEQARVDPSTGKVQRIPAQ